MRKINSLNNIKYGTIFFFINSILAFCARTVLIKYIGEDYTGLTSIIRNLIGIMSVAELGIGQAITYSLYKPLKNNDRDKINVLLVFLKKIYRYIGMLVSIGSIILALFINQIVHTNIISKSEVILYFLLFSLITISSYFLTYTQILVMADQKEYILTRIVGLINIMKIITQICITIIFKSYFLWISMELIYTLGSYLYVNYKIKNMYEWLELNKKISFKELLKENKQVFIDTKNQLYHRVAGVIVFQTDNILVASITNLKNVTIFGNYTMITSLLKSIIGLVLGGFRSSIGDLVAEGNDMKSYTIWRDMYYFSNIIAIIVSYCVYININELMYIWLGKGFVFKKFLVLLIIINLFINIIKTATGMFIFAYGLFWDTWAAMIEAIINLIVSLFLMKYLGMAGILIGTLGSNIILLTWKPYLLFKYGFKINIFKYISDICSLGIISIISIIITSIIQPSVTLDYNNIQFLINSFLSLCMISIVYFIVSLVDKKHRMFYKRSIHTLNEIIASKLNKL